MVQAEDNTAEVVPVEGHTSAVTHADEFDVEFRRAWRLAQGLAAAGLNKDVTTVEQAFGRILLGKDLGLTPTQSLMVLDVVEGNVRVRSVQLAAWVRKHPVYDYSVAEHDEQHCVIDFYYDGETCGRSSFSIEDAKRAGLVKDHPKSAWRAHPRNMVWARAMSNGVRWYCPDVTSGIPVYTEADSFDGTAEEITAGEGDGSEPGWKGVSVEHAAEAERLIERAKALGATSFSERAIVQFALNGHPPDNTVEYLREANEYLDKFEAKQEGSK